MKKLFIFVIVCLITACAEPLPDDKLNYAGHWQSADINLVIDSEGAVAYERKSGNSSTSINAPIKEFVGDDFIVGVLFFDTTFEVSEPPHKDGDVWKMTVDGVELNRLE